MNVASSRRAILRLSREFATTTPTATTDKIRQAFSYCVEQVRTHDYENYLWITQLPKVRLFASYDTLSLPDIFRL